MSTIISAGLATLFADPIGKYAIIGLGGGTILKIVGKGRDITDDLNNYFFAAGSAALCYVGAHKYLRESCDKKSLFS